MEISDLSDYYETRIKPDELEKVYPPVAREIMWDYSLQTNRLLEHLDAIKIMDLP